MPAWTFAVGPWGSLPNSELPTITGRSVTWRLLGNSEAAFTIDGRLPEAASIQELISDLRVYMGGSELFRGRVGASNDTVSPDSHAVSFSAADYRALLVRQLLYDSDTLTFTNKTDVQIVTTMIAAVAARSNGLPVTVDAHGAAGTTIPSTVFSGGQSVGDAITQLAGGVPGFDWDVVSDPNAPTHLTVNMWFPRGVNNSVVLDYPGRINSLTRAVDPSTFANTVRASGDTGIAPVMFSAAGIAADPAGRWDTQAGNTSIKTAGGVGYFGSRQLADAQVITPSWGVTLNPDSWGGPSDLWIGDQVILSVQSGRLNTTMSSRVVEISLSLDDTSDSASVTLALGAPSPTTKERRRLILIDRHLAAIERR